MANSDTPDSHSPDTQEEQPRSPLAGCLILIVMAIVALVIASSAAWALKKQTEAIAKFTQEDAKTAPIIDILEHQSEFNSLVNRIDRFEHEIENKRSSALKLCPTDLNLAIAHYDSLKGFRGQLSVDTISEDTISGCIHLPLNSTEKLPGFICNLLNIEQRPNNLNGSYQAKALLTDGSLIATLTQITPDIGEIPSEFLSGISRLKVSGEVKEESKLAGLLKKLTSVETREGLFVLTYDPQGTSPSVKEESDEIANKAKQFVALGALIFLLTMILAFIIISRWRKSKTSQ